MLNLFSKLEVNVPMLVLLKQMPKCAKFLKDLCTNKRVGNSSSKVQLRTNVSSLLKGYLPSKCRDPGSFTIPCQIGKLSFGKALLDLGAAINVMPKATYFALGLKNLSETSVVVQLADRSIKKPFGFIEDILVKVRELVFPVDFYVLDMTSDTSMDDSLILGRPFMKTAKMVISLEGGFVTMQVGNQIIRFDVGEAMRHPHEDYSLLGLSVVDSLMHEIYAERANSFKLNMFDKIDTHMCYHDSCASLISNTCLHDVFNDSSSIGSTVTEFMDSMYVNYDFDDDCTSISSLSSYNPLEEGSLLTFVGQTKDGGCEFTKEIEESSSQRFDIEEYEALRRSRLHKLREKLYLKEHALADGPHVSTLSGSGDADLNKSAEASNSKRPNCCDDLKQPLTFSNHFDELP